MWWPIDGFGCGPQASSHRRGTLEQACGIAIIRLANCEEVWPPGLRSGRESAYSDDAEHSCAGRGAMTRSEERQRARASALEHLWRLKIGLIETLQAEGEGPLIDSVRQTMARLARRIEVLDALLKREQARAGKVG